MVQQPFPTNGKEYLGWGGMGGASLSSLVFGDVLNLAIRSYWLYIYFFVLKVMNSEWTENNAAEKRVRGLRMLEDMSNNNLNVFSDRIS